MTTIQIKRGLEADRSSITPAAGELIYTTDVKQVFVGDGSTAGGNQVGGGSGAVLEATASGALANGDLVVVNSDGTVSVVAGAAGAIGTPATFASGSKAFIGSTFDATNNKVVICYQDTSNSSYGTAVVGDVSGSSINFGTPVIFHSVSIQYTSATFDSSNAKVVIGYMYSGFRAVVGTVSGTSISFGSPTLLDGTGNGYVSLTFDTVSSKTVAVYGSSSGIDSCLLTVSGTSITGGPFTALTGTPDRIQSSIDGNSGKVVAVYEDASNSSYGTAVVITISGTTTSFGTPVVFSGTNRIYNPFIAFDNVQNKALVAYRSSTGAGEAIVGTVSGTSISFGATYAFGGANISQPSVSFNEGANGFGIGYRDNGNSGYGTVLPASISGTAISFGTTTVFDSTSTTAFANATYDSNAQKSIFAYRDITVASGKGVAYSPPSTNLTATNYIGISDGAYADTDTATIQIATAVDDAQTGLTAGSQYYVQTDGTLSTTAGTPSVLAGTAISATELIIKG